MILPAIKADALAEQQPRHHQRQEHQMAKVDKAAVLTQQGQQFTLEPGVGIQWNLEWCDNPKPLRFPTHPRPEPHPVATGLENVSVSQALRMGLPSHSVRFP